MRKTIELFRRPTYTRVLFASVLAMLCAPSIAIGGDCLSLGIGIGFASYGPTGRIVTIDGWPTVLTNTGCLGVYYNSQWPCYVGYPVVYGADGSTLLWNGYPPYFGPSYPAPGVRYTGYRDWYWPRTYGAPPLAEISRRVEPALIREQPRDPPPPPPPTPVESAAQLLRARDYSQAAASYAELSRQQKWREAQELAAWAPDPIFDYLRAFALAGAREFQNAAEVLAVAEGVAAPSSPLAGKAVLGSASELREILNGAVAFAHRTNTSDGWKLVAFLMDCEGRPAQAARMRERAGAIAATKPASAPMYQTPKGPRPGWFSMPSRNLPLPPTPPAP